MSAPGTHLGTLNPKKAPSMAWVDPFPNPGVPQMTSCMEKPLKPGTDSVLSAVPLAIGQAALGSAVLSHPG